MFGQVISAIKEKLPPQDRGFLVRSMWTLNFEGGNSLQFFVEHRPDGKLPQHKGLRFRNIPDFTDSPLDSAMTRYACGSFGIVKKAIDTKGQPWALKIFHPLKSSLDKSSQMIAQSLQKMAQQEVSSWQILGKDACYFVLDSAKGEQQEEEYTPRFYLVLPWVNGQELLSYLNLKSGCNFTLEICHIIFRDVIQQLIKFKTANLLHSDIKPENIFFDEKNMQATLIDLSLCAIDSSPMALTKDYISPEYIDRCKKALEQVDKEKNSSAFPSYGENEVFYALKCIAELIYDHGFSDKKKKDRSTEFLKMIVTYCKNAHHLRGSFDELAQTIKDFMERIQKKEILKGSSFFQSPSIPLSSPSNVSSPEQRFDTLTKGNSVQLRPSLTGDFPTNSHQGPSSMIGSSPSFPK